MKVDYLNLMLYCLFIFWLSSRQSLPAPMWFAQQDKLYHAGAYALMGCLSWRCFRHSIYAPIILILTSVAFCSLYGVSDEWHQSFVSGRDSSREDWLADTLGAMIGVLMMFKLSTAALRSAEDATCVFQEAALLAANTPNPEP